ncbi:MAG TPA: tyrosine-type recombinase/integrase, partial [Pyrinomonadaceae bacterium]|nr:tyrosine-type recombinase/integrase [Pyrinomonadaceae bacterium]
MRKSNHNSNRRGAGAARKGRAALKLVAREAPPGATAGAEDFGAQKLVSLLPAETICPAATYVDNLSPAGSRSMRSRLASVARLFGFTFETFPWRELTAAHVETVRARLRKRGLAVASVNSTLSALRSVAHTARRFRQIEAEACSAICQIEGVSGSSQPAGRALGTEEVDALLGACARDPGPAGARDLALVTLLYYGGLRRDEACSVELCDYDAAAHSLRVVGKGSREELVWFEQREARAAIRRWLKRRGTASGPLLCSLWKDGRARGESRGEHFRSLTGDAVYKILRLRSREAGLKPCTPHDLRRSAITHMLERGADALAVQGFARHLSLSTTTRYDRRQEQAKKRAVRLLSRPLGLQIPRPRYKPHRRWRR